MKYKVALLDENDKILNEYHVFIEKNQGSKIVEKLFKFCCDRFFYHSLMKLAKGDFDKTIRLDILGQDKRREVLKHKNAFKEFNILN